jgi:hypothetical protein
MIEPRYKKHSGRLYASLFCAWWISFSLTAQDKIDKEVYVVKPYEPTLSDAYKISRMPEINDTVQEKPVFDYSITGRKISPDVQVAPIPAARMVPDPIPRLYKSYLKLGLGTYTTPLLELNVNSLRSKKFNLGLEARHLSSHGNIGLEDNTKTYGGFPVPGCPLRKDLVQQHGAQRRSGNCFQYFLPLWQWLLIRSSGKKICGRDIYRLFLRSV